jgi:hypothetical protein
MNSQNLQIKGAKAIGLPQDWGHMFRLILATFSMEEIEGKLIKSWNQKSVQKYLWKSWKRKTRQHKVGDDSIQKHNYINANQDSTRCGNHSNILPLFGRLEGSLTFSPLLSYTMKYTHTSQKDTIARGWERDSWILTSPPTLGILFIGKLITKLLLWPNITKTSKLG